MFEGTKDQLVIDRCILQNCRKKGKFKHGLGRLQECLRYGPSIMDHIYNGNGKKKYEYMENQLIC